MGQRARAFDAQGEGLRVSLPNNLRELTVFGAEAQQLFCESFHVAVKFKRKRRKSVGFPAPAGLPRTADALVSAPHLHRRFSTVIAVRPLLAKAPGHVSTQFARIVAAVCRRSERPGV